MNLSWQAGTQTQITNEFSEKGTIRKSENILSKDRKIKIEIRLSNRFEKTLSDTHLQKDQPLKKNRATTPINKTILEICADFNRL